LGCEKERKKKKTKENIKEETNFERRAGDNSKT
jgi:hypothetical protein